jgi:hypothetical protein
VIGVVRDVRYRTVVDEARPLMYVPVLQIYDAILKPMIAVDGDPRAFRSQMEAALHRVDPRCRFPHQLDLRSSPPASRRSPCDRRAHRRIRRTRAIVGGERSVTHCSHSSSPGARANSESDMALGATAESVLKGVFASGFN